MEFKVQVVFCKSTQEILGVYTDYYKYEHEWEDNGIDLDWIEARTDVVMKDEDDWDMKEIVLRAMMFEGSPQIYTPKKLELF